MKMAEKIGKFTKLLNTLAGWGLVATMCLVVANVIMRAVFNNPILGTYEFTGFLTALVVGLSLAYCAAVNGHIAIDFMIEKLSKRTQIAIDMITSIISFIFMCILAWRIFAYAGKLSVSGQVSPTTQTPFYIFVYILAFCFLTLCLVLLLKTVQAIKGVMAN